MVRIQYLIGMCFTLKARRMCLEFSINVTEKCFTISSIGIWTMYFLIILLFYIQTEARQCYRLTLAWFNWDSGLIPLGCLLLQSASMDKRSL